MTRVEFLKVFFKKNVVKLNIIFFVVISIASVSIVAYRLLNPVPLLEQRACKDRLNAIALEYAKFHSQNQRYPAIEELYSDPGDVFFTCPVDGGRYVAVINESGYKVKCKECGFYIENNILKRK